MSGFTVAELAAYEQQAAKPVEITPPAAVKPETPAPSTESSTVAAEVPTDATVDSSVDPTPTPTEETVTAEEEPSGASESTDSKGDPEPKGSRARERIEDLVAERNALKKYAEYLQTQMAVKPTEAPTAPVEAAPVVTTEDAPTLESVGFDTDKWTKAMHAWTAKQIEKGVSKAVAGVQEQQQAVSQRQAFETRAAAFAATTPDFQVVIGNPNLPPLDKEVAKTVVTSEIGPQIIYHLGKNPDKAVRIARMNPVQQAQAIGRLEAELTQSAKVPQKKAPTTTKAPAPPTPTPAGGAARVDPMTMSMNDFVKHEREQALQKRVARNRH